MFYLVNEQYSFKNEDGYIPCVNDYLIELHKVLNVCCALKLKLSNDQLVGLTKHIYIIECKPTQTKSNNHIIKNKITYNFVNCKLYADGDNRHLAPYDDHILRIQKMVETCVDNLRETKTTQPVQVNNSKLTHVKPTPNPPAPVVIPTVVEPVIPDEEKLKLQQELEVQMKELETELEDINSKCCDQLSIISERNKLERLAKERELEKRRIFESDVNTYRLMKNDLINGKLREIPFIFAKKYTVIEQMDCDGLLYKDNSYDSFVEIMRILDSVSSDSDSDSDQNDPIHKNDLVDSVDDTPSRDACDSDLGETPSRDECDSDLDETPSESDDVYHSNFKIMSKELSSLFN